jgi:HNH endonuclease
VASLKEDLFAKGASALSRMSRYTDLYGCPTCMRLLPVAALNSGDLTLEHVPPEAMGGRGILLTCKSCNNTAGHTVDAAVVGRDRFFQLGHSLFRKDGEFRGPVKIEFGGVVINATLITKDGSVTILVDRGRNNPRLLDQQIAEMERDLNSTGSAEFRLTARIKFGFDRARVGDLRSAYLAAFATFGYRYAYDARLDVVRQQTLHPDQEFIDGAWWIPLPDLTEDPMLMVMVEPVPAVLVRLGPVLVALPWLIGPSDFYAAIRQAFQPGVRATQKIDILEWPTGLHMLGDVA